MVSNMIDVKKTNIKNSSEEVFFVYFERKTKVLTLHMAKWKNNIAQMETTTHYI